MFSPQQDVEVGHPVSRAAERQVPMLNDCRVEYYLNTLGFRRMRPATNFRTRTRPAVNDRAISTFAGKIKFGKK